MTNLNSVSRNYRDWPPEHLKMRLKHLLDTNAYMLIMNNMQEYENWDARIEYLQKCYYRIVYER